MKKVTAFFLTLIMLSQLFVFGQTSYKEPPENNAKAALVYNMDTNQIIYSKNINEKVYPASITKIMTAALLLENIKDYEDTVTISKDLDYSDLIVGSSTANLQDGEEITFDTLLKCIMVSSANEACNTAARYVAGSIDEFVKMMNDKAKELGCKNTHFKNTHGLPNDDHYTTAYDMLLITKYALSVKDFDKYCNITSFELPPIDGTPRKYYTTNNLIMKNRGEATYFKYAKGIKTGTTKAAGSCVVSYADNEKSRYMTLVFGEKIDDNGTKHSFSTAKALFEWAYGNHKNVQVIFPNDPVHEVKVKNGNEKDFISLTSKDKYYVTLKKGENKDDVIEITSEATKEVSAPVDKDTILGYAKVLYSGKEVLKVPLYASESIERNEFLYALSVIKNFFSNPITIVVSIILVLLLIWYIVLMIKKNKRKYKKVRRKIRF